MDAEHYRQTPPELAQALAGQGRIGDAIACLREAISVNPGNARAMNELALFLARRRKTTYPRRLSCCKRPSPRPPATRWAGNPAWIYATCPDRRFRNGPRAIKLARRACELSGWKNAPYRQTLADAYVEAGDFDSDIEELRAVVQLDPRIARRPSN